MFGTVFNELTENTVINIHNPNNNTVQFNKRVVLAVRNSQQDEFLNSFQGDNISQNFGVSLRANDAVFVDCLEIIGGFNFFVPYLNDDIGLEGALLFHMPWPYEFFGLISVVHSLAGGEGFAISDFSLDGVVVIETKKRDNFRRREVSVSAKYWKTFFSAGLEPGGESAGVSIHVENNIEPIVVSGKFERGGDAPQIDSGTISDLFFGLFFSP